MTRTIGMPISLSIACVTSLAVVISPPVGGQDAFAQSAQTQTAKTKAVLKPKDTKMKQQSQPRKAGNKSKPTNPQELRGLNPQPEPPSRAIKTR